MLNDLSHGIIMANQSLVLQKVKRQNRGSYQCIAFNDEGESVSEPYNLKILCKNLIVI